MPENIAYTLTAEPSQANGQVATGRVAFPATAIVATDYAEFDVGFRPKKVNFVNMTDRISGEFFEDMADNSCLKTAANGTRTLEVTGGITLTDSGFRVLQNATLALILASKTCYFEAYA